MSIESEYGRKKSDQNWKASKWFRKSYMLIIKSPRG